MFNDINEIRLMGNVTGEPELRFTPSGAAVLSFSMATNRRYKQGEEWKDEVSYHNIVVWGPKAQSLSERISKGTKVHISGRSQTRSWDGQDGKKNYKTEVIAENVTLIARYKGEGQGGAFNKDESSPAAAPKANPKGADDYTPPSDDEVIDPDDLPF